MRPSLRLLAVVRLTDEMSRTQLQSFVGKSCCCASACSPAKIAASSAAENAPVLTSERAASSRQVGNALLHAQQFVGDALSDEGNNLMRACAA